MRAATSPPPTWRTGSARSDPVCVVDPQTGGLYVMSGLQYGGNWSLFNDVYYNPGGYQIDVENAWSVVTLAAAFPPRDQASAVAAVNPHLGGRTVMWIAAGHNNGYQFGQASWTTTQGRNDVWASSDLGVTWSAATLAAPWMNRTGAQMAVSPNGTLVIAEGSVVGSGVSDFYPHDVWASVDGGYSWGLCSGLSDSTWQPRRDFGMTFDAQGRLWMAAGECRGTTQPGSPAWSAADWWVYDVNDGEKYDDLWVSAISFDDPAAVATYCGVQASPCGIGARCWPIQGQRGVPVRAAVDGAAGGVIDRARDVATGGDLCAHVGSGDVGSGGVDVRTCDVAAAGDVSGDVGSGGDVSVDVGPAIGVVVSGDDVAVGRLVVGDLPGGDVPGGDVAGGDVVAAVAALVVGCGDLSGCGLCVVVCVADVAHASRLVGGCVFRCR